MQREIQGFFIISGSKTLGIGETALGLQDVRPGSGADAVQDRAVEFHHDPQAPVQDLLQGMFLPPGLDLRTAAIFKRNTVIQGEALQELSPPPGNTKPYGATICPHIEGKILLQQFQQLGVHQTAFRNAFQAAEAVLPDPVQQVSEEMPRSCNIALRRLLPSGEPWRKE